MKTHERAANLALAGLSLAPLVVKVNPNVNVILTACLAVYVGCYRSVKPTPPAETMSKEHAMRFPLVGSAMLLSLFLLFKFLSKDLVNTVLTAYFFILGIAALCATLLPSIKRFLPKEWNDNAIVWRAPLFHSLSVEFTRSQVVASIPGFFFCIWYAAKKHWLANNVLGISFCIQGIEMLSLGSFKTGAILLGGLFFYDIFWVFFTPVMVSIFVALALRFDVSRGIKNRYFNSAFLGYTVGLTVTIIVMNWFQAAQPALLYIVPGVIGFVAVHCLWNGEVKPLLEYNESKAEEEEACEEDTDSKQNKKEE
uniref:Peptidase A22B family protein n=1 Tax=Oryza meridionalis TaxID=40149 RepID=A0A0E0DRV5_9ORYZ